jgi:hypothetical protein
MQRSLSFFLLSAISALAVGACGTSRLPKIQDINPSDQVEDGLLTLGSTRLRPQVCSGIDVKPEYGTLDEESIVTFLKARGLPVRVERARADLFYVEVQVDPEHNDWARLRVAILATPSQAGRELHDGVLAHGEGSWGIHRANLAVLAPLGNFEDTVAFVGKTKLACWGVWTVAGRDDTFVVPGGYREL